MVAALAGTTGLLLLVVFTIVNVACLVLRTRHGRPSPAFRAPDGRAGRRGAWPARSSPARGPATPRTSVQYKIAAWLLGLGVVLWALTWLPTAAVRAKRDRLPRRRLAGRLTARPVPGAAVRTSSRRASRIDVARSAGSRAASLTASIAALVASLAVHACVTPAAASGVQHPLLDPPGQPAAAGRSGWVAVIALHARPRAVDLHAGERREHGPRRRRRRAARRRGSGALSGLSHHSERSWYIV